MRDIKFRGYHDNEGWVVGSLFISSLNSRHIVRNEHECPLIVHPDSVGEYIGLEDINGDDICEGDIVEFYESNDDICMGYVEYDTDYYVPVFCIVTMDGEIETCFDGVEIIGNLYENKDLIK